MIHQELAHPGLAQLHCVDRLDQIGTWPTWSLISLCPEVADRQSVDRWFFEKQVAKRSESGFCERLQLAERGLTHSACPLLNSWELFFERIQCSPGTAYRPIQDAFGYGDPAHDVALGGPAQGTNLPLSYPVAGNGRAFVTRAKMGLFGLAEVRSGSNHRHVVPVDRFRAVLAAKQAADLSLTWAT